MVNPPFERHPPPLDTHVAGMGSNEQTSRGSWRGVGSLVLTYGTLLVLLSNVVPWVLGPPTIGVGVAFWGPPILWLLGLGLVALVVARWQEVTWGWVRWGPVLLGLVILFVGYRQTWTYLQLAKPHRALLSIAPGAAVCAVGAGLAIASAAFPIKLGEQAVPWWLIGVTAIVFLGIANSLVGSNRADCYRCRAPDKVAQGNLRDTVMAAKTCFTHADTYVGCSRERLIEIDPALVYTAFGAHGSGTGTVSFDVAPTGDALFAAWSTTGTCFYVRDEPTTGTFYGSELTGPAQWCSATDAANVTGVSW
jgi:hypothetical protein